MVPIQPKEPSTHPQAHQTRSACTTNSSGDAQAWFILGCAYHQGLGWGTPTLPLSPPPHTPRSPAGPGLAPSPPASECSLSQWLFHTLSTLFPEDFSSPGTSTSTCHGLSASCEISVQEETLFHLTRRMHGAQRRYMTYPGSHSLQAGGKASHHQLYLMYLAVQD